MKLCTSARTLKSSQILIVWFGTEDGERLQYVAQTDRGDRVGVRAVLTVKGAPVLGFLQIRQRSSQHARLLRERPARVQPSS